MGRMRSLIRAGASLAAVCALALAGCGNPLAIVQDVVARSLGPVAPTISSAVGGDRQVTVSWDAVSGAASYNLYWAEGSTVTVDSGTKVEAAVSPQVVGGLTKGTTYAFIVTTVNAYGESVASPVVTAVPGVIPAAATISGTVALSRKAMISWDAVADAESYNLYWAAGTTVSVAGGTKIAGVTSPHIVGGLTNGVTYAFIVTAVGSLGEGEPSAVVTVTPYVQWEALGGAGFSPITVEYTSLAIDSGGASYVAFSDNSDSGKATVMKFNGTDWVTVGNAHFTEASASYVTMGIDSHDVLYVGAVSTAYGLTNIPVVYKYGGTTWSLVGSAAITSSQSVYATIAFDVYPTADLLYVAYANATSSYNGYALYNSSGTWMNVPVGGASFSDASALFPSLVVDTAHTPYVAYQDGNDIYSRLTVKYLNGSAWYVRGVSAGFSSGTAYYCSLKIASGSGSLYVAFSDGGSSNKATVMKYSSGWNNVGSTAGFSDGIAYYTSLAFDSNDVPYVAYQDVANGNKLTVKKYNGSSWVTVGMEGRSAGEAQYVSLAIHDDVPYVAFKDGGNGNKATVLVYR